MDKDVTPAAQKTILILILVIDHFLSAQMHTILISLSAQTTTIHAIYDAVDANAIPPTRTWAL